MYNPVSPVHYSTVHGRRRRRLLVVMLAIAILLFLVGHLLVPGVLYEAGDEQPAVLRGFHPLHFPVYFNLRSYAVTPTDKAIMFSWRKKHESNNVFKYQLGTSLEPLITRYLGDNLSMVVQQAVGRSKKRKLNKIIKSVGEPFNEKGFHFFKIKGREVLGKLSTSGERFLELNLQNKQDVPVKEFIAPDQNLIIVNTNPFAAFHILIIPEIGLGHSQKLTHSSLLMALGFADTCSSYLKLVYNSIGAGASVNHHHWQGFYLKSTLPIEKAKTKQLFIANGVLIQEILGWPIRSFKLTSDSRARLADAVFRIVEELLRTNTAHNILITDKGSSVVVVPRKIGNYPDVTKKQVAAMEVLGFWIIPNEEEYKSLTPDSAHSFLAGARPETDLDIAQLFR
eukprot:TRINITY_DN14891_c0_g1_i1.p1 TRINITY_DN14891_c0_g1~~TRINITY_DN14891_c0_g1_i1.p1  ORF type:complete len:396 (+),score=38.85 TRINITY_DN14891_c0_g1_i1:47-1234(+)